MDTLACNPDGRYLWGDTVTLGPDPPMTEKSPRVQRLIELGETLYGERWQRQMAIDIGKDQKQVNRWALGKYEPDDAVIEQLEDLARARIAEIEQVLGAKRKRKA